MKAGDHIRAVLTHDMSKLSSAFGSNIKGLDEYRCNGAEHIGVQTPSQEYCRGIRLPQSTKQKGK